MVERLHPSPVQIGALVIKPQIRRQADPIAFILVLGRAVYHPRAVEDHVSSLIIRNQPFPVPALLFQKLLRIVAQMPSFAHVLIERTNSFLLAHPLGLLTPHKLLFTGFADGTAILKVHEAAARRAAVADRDPGGDEDRVALAQEKLVVVDSSAEAVWHIVLEKATV